MKTRYRNKGKNKIEEEDEEEEDIIIIDLENLENLENSLDPTSSKRKTNVKNRKTNQQKYSSIHTNIKKEEYENMDVTVEDEINDKKRKVTKNSNQTELIDLSTSDDEESQSVELTEPKTKKRKLYYQKSTKVLKQ